MNFLVIALVPQRTLAANGAPLFPRQRVADLELLTLSVLRKAGVRILVIGELHNIQDDSLKLRLALASMGRPDTKVSDLCVELGVTRQTLYRHVSPSGELRPDGHKRLLR